MRSTVRVSVVVPVFNAQAHVERLVKALTEQNFPEPYEVILVDDGSVDGTRRAFEEVRGRVDFEHLEFHQIEHGGPAVARNAGAKLSRGEVVLFTDADCVPNEDWIGAMVEPLSDPDVAAVGGSYRTLNGEYRLARFVGHDIAYRHGRYGEFIDFAATFSLAIRKEVLEDVGMFDQDYSEANAEDNDLSYELVRRGYKIKYQPAGWVYHPHPHRLRVFLKQQFDRAKWRIKLHRENRRFGGDAYAGPATLYQPLVWGLVLAAQALAFLAWLLPVLFGFLVPRPLAPWQFAALSLAAGIATLYALNFKVIHWIRKNTRESPRDRAYFVAVMYLRSLAWFLGGLSGLYRFLKRGKGKGKN
ncbi:MAG: glycosyltransferase [Promethearchaeota archaeon]